MNIRWNFWTRKMHYWAAAIIALPTLVIIASGLLLQLKKQFPTIQPPTHQGSTQAPALSFPRVLEIVAAIPEADVVAWSDIKRLDVQPARGIVKVHARNDWEIQLDHTTGEVLQVAYRRSDVLESIHDGSFFHDAAKLFLFFPSGLGLLLLWISGIYLFIMPFWARRKKRPQTAAATMPPKR